jgi:ubiquinol-cytochrome c reductase cytochrome b subunit
MTWATGAIAMIMSIATAFTGYLIQTNFNSQWIAFESKDVLNSVGMGAFVNVTNFGQMVLMHVALLPLCVGVIVVMHVLLVRKRGVVPPAEAIDHALVTTEEVAS